MKIYLSQDIHLNSTSDCYSSGEWYWHWYREWPHYSVEEKLQEGLQPPASSSSGGSSGMGQEKLGCIKVSAWVHKVTPWHIKWHPDTPHLIPISHHWCHIKPSNLGDLQVPSFPIGEQAGGTEIETDISAKKLRTLGGPAIPLRCRSHLGKELIRALCTG